MNIVEFNLSKYDMVLYNISYQRQVKAQMKFIISDTEKPAIHDVGDVAGV